MLYVVCSFLEKGQWLLSLVTVFPYGWHMITLFNPRRDGDGDDQPTQETENPDAGSYDPGDDIGERIGEHEGADDAGIL